MMPSCSSLRRTSCECRARRPDLAAVRQTVACALIALLGQGCGAQSGSTDGAPNSEPWPQDSPECTSTPRCAGPETDEGGNPTVCVQTVDADVVDEQGNPVAGFHAQICSTKVCMGAKSDAQGHLHFVLCKNMIDPALDIPGRATYVTYAVPITRAVERLGTLTLVPLANGAAQMGDQGAADKTYASGGAVLVVPAGAEVSVDPIDHPEPEDQIFRAARLDPDAAPGLAESSPALSLFYGLAPTGTTVSKPASLTLPNWNQWPAGAEVEFFVQGAASAQSAAGKGSEWSLIGGGRVSEDGETVRTGTGVGLTFISLVGVKRTGK